MPSLAGLGAGLDEWCQQEAAIVVIASEVWKAIGCARCLRLPCDVGLMV